MAKAVPYLAGVVQHRPLFRGDVAAQRHEPVFYYEHRESSLCSVCSFSSVFSFRHEMTHSLAGLDTGSRSKSRRVSQRGDSATDVMRVSIHAAESEAILS